MAIGWNLIRRLSAALIIMTVLVFEVFDKHPANSRAMFGGGRYNGLAEIFGEKNFPAVGFAPGDETTRLFLESWDLLNKIKSRAPGNLLFCLY